MDRRAWTRESLARTIDHALLAPQAGLAELQAACELAATWRVKSLCVKPCHVRPAARILAGTGVLVGATVSFPHGADGAAIKAAQARAAFQDGAGEVDMVVNLGALHDGDIDLVRGDIAAVVMAAEGEVVKVILECALLSDEQKVAACLAAEEAGANFVKTSTGFASRGATEHDVALLRRTVGSRLGVKASGGIRSLEDALRMLEAGANRLGTSSTDAILESLPE